MGMAGQEAEIARRLAKGECYRTMFARAFPGDGVIDFGHVAKALAAFERTLVSFDSPYDAWIGGSRTALSPAAIAGAALFGRACSSCHSGPLLSDGRFHAILPASSADPGLGEITMRAADIGRFRTPSLRNVALTAPYFHDGSAPTLEAAIATMARYQLGRRLDLEQIEQIAAFLRALTGELEGVPL
jgi:cytochrome c peroxidase